MGEQTIVVTVVVWGAFVLLGLYVASQKGRSPGEATLISLLFGPFGVLLVALLLTLSHPAATAGPAELGGNPPIGEWADLIDWTGVVTEEDEKRAKLKAYHQYMCLFGRRPTRVGREGADLNWTCVCGVTASARPEAMGTVVGCPECRRHAYLDVPGL